MRQVEHRQRWSSDGSIRNRWRQPHVVWRRAGWCRRHTRCPQCTPRHQGGRDRRPGGLVAPRGPVPLGRVAPPDSRGGPARRPPVPGTDADHRRDHRGRGEHPDPRPSDSGSELTPAVPGSPRRDDGAPTPRAVTPTRNPRSVPAGPLACPAALRDGTAPPCHDQVGMFAGPTGPPPALSGADLLRRGRALTTREPLRTFGGSKEISILARLPLARAAQPPPAPDVGATHVVGLYPGDTWYALAAAGRRQFGRWARRSVASTRAARRACRRVGQSIGGRSSSQRPSMPGPRPGLKTSLRAYILQTHQTRTRCGHR